MLDFDLIAHKIEEILSQYTHKNYQLAIRLPFQLPIRLQGFIFGNQSTMLENKYTTRQKNEKIELFKFKEAVKQMVKDRIQADQLSSDSDCMVTLGFDHEESVEDYKFLKSLVVKKRVRKGITTYEGVSLDKVISALQHTSVADYQSANLLPLPLPKTLPKFTISIHTNSIYIAGRYNKLCRHISNSKWIIGGKRMTPDSIEELIGDLLKPIFKNDGYKFSSAGREDSDVLMLGTGRPFYFEILQPRKNVFSQDDMDSLQQAVNKNGKGKILVRDLQIVSKEDTDVLKKSASTKRKFYSCVIRLSNEVNKEMLEKVSEMKEVVLQQRNPTRVPRRADIVREKVVHSMTLHSLSPTTVRVDLETSAGLYVKEFMHGDQGRTIPYIGGLLDTEVEVISLDVLGVDLEWPEKKSDYLECQSIVDQAVKVDESAAINERE